MRIAIARTARMDHVAIVRRDGSEARFSTPSKGPVPHDLVHFCVERAFGLGAGFWGSVAAGEDPEAIQQRAARGGHASAGRAELPDPGIVELVQAERLVECFEAESWSGASDDAEIVAMAEAGWCASKVPPLALGAIRITAARDQLLQQSARWRTLQEGEPLDLEWEE